MGTSSKGDNMSNYEIDERERKESQKQREQRVHGLDERYSSKEGFRVDDQKDIKNIVKSSKSFDDTVHNLYEDDEVTNPKHYDKVGFAIQPIEYITKNELDFLEGNVIKYVSRYQHKGGVNDLLKARTYIDFLIEREKGRE
jgi:hypothetical protein